MKVLKQLYEYTLLVFVRWKTIITTLLFVVLTIPTAIGLLGGNVALPTWVWVILLLVDLHIAGFMVYRETIKKLPKSADLSISYRIAKVNVNGFSDMPLSPIRFMIFLDLVNRGQEPAMLVILDVEDINLNFDLFSNIPLNKKIYKTNHPQANTAISLPYSVKPGHWESNIVYEIEIGLPTRDPVLFAKRLNELKSYEIVLQYQWEALDRSKHSGIIRISESFDGFKKQIIDNWKRHKRHNLVVEAHGS